MTPSENRVFVALRRGAWAFDCRRCGRRGWPHGHCGQAADEGRAHWRRRHLTCGVCETGLTIPDGIPAHGYQCVCGGTRIGKTIGVRP